MITRLFVRPDGSVHGVYTDLVRELVPAGSLQIQRASTVEWNSEDLVWESRLQGGWLLCSHESREECVRMEHQLIENRWTTTPTLQGERP